MRSRLILILAFWVGVNISCEDGQSHQYSQPVATDDGWETAAATDTGIQESRLAAMGGYLISRSDHEVHSVLIIKDGFLVFELYLSGPDYCYYCNKYQGPQVAWDMHTRHHIASVTKSFASTLIGIAIDQGYIVSTDDPMFNYMSDYSDMWDASKWAITLEHLLTMSPGFEWHEYNLSMGDPTNDILHLVRSSDPIRYILSKPMVMPPGSTFDYGGGASNLLGEVIREATGETVTDYANDVLFDPLGIAPVAWRLFDNDLDYVSGSLYLTPREMAKLGWLFVNDGQWQSAQIVSSDWVDRATQNYLVTGRQGWEGYGFQWWTHTYRTGVRDVDAFAARGWGGQMIVGVPELNLVVVFTGADYVNEYSIGPNLLMESYILPAVL